MGSAVCRAKKVAPALATDDRRNLEGGRFFNSPNAPAEDLRRSRHVCPDQESDVACDEEELEQDVEKILGVCGSADGVLSKRLFQKDFFSSRTCGLCYSKHGQHESDSISSNSRLTQTEGVRRDDDCPKPVTGGPVRADPLCTKAVCVPGFCEQPAFALPVFYDASEEDLMNVIEREFG